MSIQRESNKQRSEGVLPEGTLVGTRNNTCVIKEETTPKFLDDTQASPMRRVDLVL